MVRVFHRIRSKKSGSRFTPPRAARAALVLGFLPVWSWYVRTAAVFGLRASQDRARPSLCACQWRPESDKDGNNFLKNRPRSRKPLPGLILRQMQRTLDKE